MPLARRHASVAMGALGLAAFLAAWQASVPMVGLEPYFYPSPRDAVDALGSYGATMFSVALHLPVIALWLFTFFAFAAIGWRLLRWTARVFFGWKMQPKA